MHGITAIVYGVQLLVNDGILINILPYSYAYTTEYCRNTTVQLLQYHAVLVKLIQGQWTICIID
jgi:hypothetical protein